MMVPIENFGKYPQTCPGCYNSKLDIMLIYASREGEGGGSGPHSQTYFTFEIFNGKWDI